MCIRDSRIENPKGVWRSAGNSDNFHVTLMRLPYDDAEDFKPVSYTHLDVYKRHSGR